jgi:lipopolysaccharide cholinephosphotransferase
MNIKFMKEIWQEAKQIDRQVSFLHKLISVYLNKTQKPLEGKILKKTLKLTDRVVDFLDKYGVDYWLESGTLLGVVREGRLLPWDHDVDITIRIEDLPRIINKLKSFHFKYGYRVEIVVNRADATPLKKGDVRLIKIQSRRLFVLPGWAQLDMFVKIKHDDKMYWSIRNRALKSAPAHFTDNLAVIEFNSRTYKVPKDSRGYLAYRFGDDWETPKKDYDNIRDDKSVEQLLDPLY